MQNHFHGKVAVKILLENPGGELLVVRDGPVSDYEVPGGRIDKNESIEQTIKRELKEEVELDIKDLKYDIFDTFQSHNPHEKIDHLYFIVIVSISEEEAKQIGLSNEVQEFVWVNKNNHKDYKYKKFLEETINKFIN
jgi:8-oxo-dGTP pyrophosphatase MutT (NUDIX family)